jgi:hypothetical protein
VRPASVNRWPGFRPPTGSKFKPELAIFNDFVKVLAENSGFVLTLAILDDWMEIRGFDGFI